MLRRVALPLWCLVLAVVVLGPALAPGYVLVYDMVFTPRQPLVPASVGLGTALPRAVPGDAVVAVLSTLLNGQLLQKAALLGALFFAALGAGKLLADRPLAVQLFAATAYGWNAFVAERLLIGHWTVLVAYAALPWIARAGLAVRAGDPKAWARLVLTTLPAVLGPTGGLLAAGVGVAACGLRKAWLPLGVAAVLNAPWWLAGVLHPGATGADPAGVGAFAARAEHWGGELLTVLGLGGIWNADVVPASRTGPVAVAFTFLVLAAAALGIRGWRAPNASFGALSAPNDALGANSRARASGLTALAWLGLLGVVIALLGAFEPTADLLRWASDNVPGAGLLRDGTRFLAWFALPLVLAAALGIERVARFLAARVAAAASTVLVSCAVVLPIAVLPDLAWGGFGRLEPVDYPDDYAVVASRVEQAPGDVLLLPFGSYREFDWNARRPQLTPAPRWLPRTTLATDHLVVVEDGEPKLVRGEDVWAQRVADALAAGQDLGELGVGWVVVEHTTPERVEPSLLRGLRTEHDGEHVSLYRVPGPIAAEAPAAVPPTLPIYLGYAGVLAVALGAAVVRLRPGRRVREV